MITWLLIWLESLCQITPALDILNARTTMYTPEIRRCTALRNRNLRPHRWHVAKQKRSAKAQPKHVNNEAEDRSHKKASMPKRTTASRINGRDNVPFKPTHT
ncbi:hypothetical protein PLICRDRAFT_431133 [Plicaturopsis crispa FD-325 SS-3]|uniref:Secreted protein n=1 Tax=Plicaturopsis crispa FD-325 SS-3 TaxID=944288 RepID=A0A0C9T704_PLICR|nr:hypothetical protein PLICRDRAFT_431133 [Plicaturopsis crispa FD-325 SS-3]